MSTASRLRALLPEIRAALGRSRRAWAPELLEYIEISLERSHGRAEAAARRSAQRSDEIRAGILKAAGALTSVHRGVAGVVQRRIARKGPEAFGLNRVPDLRTIRRALRRKEDKPVPECPPERVARRYGAGVAPTT